MAQFKVNDKLYFICIDKHMGMTNVTYPIICLEIEENHEKP